MTCALQPWRKALANHLDLILVASMLVIAATAGLLGWKGKETSWPNGSWTWEGEINGIGQEEERVLMAQLCAEHGVFELPAARAGDPAARLGARLRVVPGYHDLSVVLHDRLVAVREGRVEEVWAIESRGRLD